MLHGGLLFGLALLGTFGGLATGAFLGSVLQFGSRDGLTRMLAAAIVFLGSGAAGCMLTLRLGRLLAKRQGDRRVSSSETPIGRGGSWLKH